MREFVGSNPGLESRFNRYVEFYDYTPAELRAIFDKLCREGQYAPSEESSKFADELFQQMYDQRSANFANGREVRNLFERAVAQQANRLAKLTEPASKEALCALEKDDLERAARNLEADRAAASQSSPFDSTGDDDGGNDGDADGGSEESVESAFA